MVKWGLASAGFPLVSQALAPMAQGRARPEENAARRGLTVSVSTGLQMFYRDEWFGAPWLKPEPAVFLHGNLETSDVWYGWVPRMAQHFRLILPDLPGFGGSTVPSNFEWTLANYAKAVADFLDAIGVESAHIIGAKTGGAIAMQFAATYPQRTRTLVVASGPFTPRIRKLRTSRSKSDSARQLQRRRSNISTSYATKPGRKRDVESRT